MSTSQERIVGSVTARSSQARPSPGASAPSMSDGTVSGQRVLLAEQLGARDRYREPIGALQGALLGVVGLILAFGLTLAVGRYQDRRSDVVTDANTIGTAYLRAQTIAEPQRTNSLALLAGLFAPTAVLSQLISNMATALIVFPVALQAAQDLDLSPRPMPMSVAVAPAAALITPVATPANLMVMEPGGYRFSDYCKLGLPLLVLYGLVAVGLVPVFWRF
jgi:hypothetical protein